MDAQTREMWDRAAPTFDEAADHGLGDVQVRAAWRTLLLDAQALMAAVTEEWTVRHLDDPALWGRPIRGERYLLVGICR